jgi:hypothetical protein
LGDTITDLEKIAGRLSPDDARAIADAVVKLKWMRANERTIKAAMALRNDLDGFAEVLRTWPTARVRVVTRQQFHPAIEGSPDDIGDVD